MGALLVLALAAAAFAAAVAPLTRKPEPIPQERSGEDLKGAVEKSIHELRTDLQLHKIAPDDLRDIEAFLEEASKET